MSDKDIRLAVSIQKPNVRISIEKAVPDIRMTVSRAAKDIRIAVERAERQISLEVNRGGQYFPEYEGPLLITPGAQAQTIPTQYRVLMRNIVVGPVPSNYGLITYNGRTITVS